MYLYGELAAVGDRAAAGGHSVSYHEMLTTFKQGYHSRRIQAARDAIQFHQQAAQMTFLEEMVAQTAPGTVTGISSASNSPHPASVPTSSALVQPAKASTKYTPADII